MTIKELAVRYTTNPEDFWCEDTDTIIELHREEKSRRTWFYLGNCYARFRK